MSDDLKQFPEDFTLFTGNLLGGIFMFLVTPTDGLPYAVKLEKLYEFFSSDIAKSISDEITARKADFDSALESRNLIINPSTLNTVAGWGAVDSILTQGTGSIIVTANSAKPAQAFFWLTTKLGANCLPGTYEVSFNAYGTDPFQLIVPAVNDFNFTYSELFTPKANGIRVKYKFEIGANSINTFQILINGIGKTVRIGDLKISLSELNTVTSSAISTAISAEVAARNTAIATAIDALKAGAPAAFDTLIEISNQLSDDNNAISALVNTIAAETTTRANAIQNLWAETESIDSNLSAEVSARISAIESLTSQLEDEQATRASEISAEVTARNTAITSAIDALKAGAPAAFDTLIEISNQLSNDNNAIAALANVIAANKRLALATSSIDYPSMDEFNELVAYTPIAPGTYGLHIADGFYGETNMTFEVGYLGAETTGGDGDQDWFEKITLKNGDKYYRTGYHQFSAQFVWNEWIKLGASGVTTEMLQSGISSAKDVIEVNMFSTAAMESSYIGNYPFYVGSIVAVSNPNNESENGIFVAHETEWVQQGDFTKLYSYQGSLYRLRPNLALSKLVDEVDVAAMIAEAIANITPAIPANALLEDDGTPITEDNGEIILDL